MVPAAADCPAHDPNRPGAVYLVLVRLGAVPKPRAGQTPQCTASSPPIVPASAVPELLP